MATRSQKQEQMCCLTIGFQDFLTTAKNGMRIVELMQNVIEADHHYVNGFVYEPKQEPLKVEFKLIRANQIVTQQRNSTLMLGHD